MIAITQIIEPSGNILEIRLGNEHKKVEVIMIDYIHIELIINDVPEEVRLESEKSFEWKELIFIPKFTKQGRVYSYQAFLKNLLLTIWGNRLIVKNSIHKFYHGNNHSDFTLYDFHKAIQKLSELLGADISEAEVKKIEYGCNFPYRNPENLYRSLISYQRGYFERMPDGVKTYGRRQISTDYMIKAYDKQYEVQAHDNLIIPPVLRFEKRVKNMRYLRGKGIEIRLVKHLLNEKIWEALFRDLIETFKKIRKTPEIKIEALTFQQIGELAIISDIDFAELVKRKSSRTLSRYKTNCLKLPPSFRNKRFQKALQRKCKRLLK